MTSAKRRLFGVVTFVLTVLAALAGGEWLARLFWHGGPPADLSERILAYRYDANLGWFPLTNSETRVRGNRWIQVHHNQDGFRDPPHGPKTKPRIAFVGDSFVWGYDVEQDERFTDRLQRLLPDWEVLNLGVSGYATDQEFILLRQCFAKYQPDLVVLAFCDNDLLENNTNCVHGGYYKPYFEKLDQRLVQRGVPVPKSIHYYRQEHPALFKSRLVQLVCQAWIGWRSPRRGSAADPSLGLIVAMKQFVEGKGSRFMVGFCSDIQAEKKRAFCQACQIDHLFLLAASLRTQDHIYMYPNLGNHWTARGHEQVCLAMTDYLATNHFLASKGVAH